MSQVLYSADVTVRCACASMRGVLHRSVWSFLYLHSKPLLLLFSCSEPVCGRHIRYYNHISWFHLDCWVNMSSILGLCWTSVCFCVAKLSPDLDTCSDGHDVARNEDAGISKPDQLSLRLFKNVSNILRWLLWLEHGWYHVFFAVASFTFTSHFYFSLTSGV